MLAKLLKYELSSNGSTFLILGLVTFLVAALLGSPLNQFQNMQILLTIILLAMFLIVFIYVVSTIYTSYANLYKGKATFELMVPATPGQHLAAKLIAASIWALVGFMIFLLCAVILGLVLFSSVQFYFTGAEFFTAVRNLMHNQQLFMTVLTQIGAFLVSLVLSCLLNAAIMFAAISIGYLLPKFNDTVSIVLIFIGWFIQEHIMWLFVIYPNLNDPNTYATLAPIEISSQVLTQSVIFWAVMAVSCVLWALIAWLPFSRRFNVR